MRLGLPDGRLKAGASVNIRIERFSFGEFGTVRYALWHGMLGIELPFEMATKKQIHHWKKIVGSAQNT